MMWDVAAGIIIGGGAIGAVALGFALCVTLNQEGDTTGPGWFVVLVGLGLAAFVFAKAAHYV